MATFTIRRGDTLPILEVALLDPDGSAHDLTGVDNVFLRVLVTPTYIPQYTMTIQDAAGGIVRYAFQAADWNTVGAMEVEPGETKEWEMEYEVVAGTNRMTFPTDGYDTLRVRGDLA